MVHVVTVYGVSRASYIVVPVVTESGANRVTYIYYSGACSDSGISSADGASHGCLYVVTAVPADARSESDSGASRASYIVVPVVTVVSVVLVDGHSLTLLIIMIILV